MTHDMETLIPVSGADASGLPEGPLPDPPGDRPTAGRGDGQRGTLPGRGPGPGHAAGCSSPPRQVHLSAPTCPATQPHKIDEAPHRLGDPPCEFVVH